MESAKSVLFIAPEFFHFHELVQQRLRESGCKVYFVADRPSKHALIKILIRKARFLLSGYLWSHYTKALSDIPSDIDEVFIIKGEGLTPQIVDWMKKRFTKARFQIYLWDSLKNNKSALNIVDLMDRSWTFDFEDAAKYPKLKHLSNFLYIQPQFNVQSWKTKPIQWNLAFFGTAHADRLKVLSKISERLSPEFSMYRFIYYPSPLLYYVRKFFDPFFRRFPRKEMSLKPRVGADWEQILQSTVAVLDIHHPKQTGLTHRAIEGLAMGLKLVTTNDSIRQSPFYDERLVRIIDREDPRIEPEFLLSRPEAEPPAAIKDLELSRWLDQIFS